MLSHKKPIDLNCGVIMNRLILLIATILVISSISNAQTYSHKRAMISSGGGWDLSGDYFNYGVTGESAVCKIEGDNYNHYSGFLYGAPCSPVGFNEIDFTLPLCYELNQNYPNPFNPTTTIEFSLPKKSKVEIDIFNLLGQKVNSLIEDKILEPGYHSVTWDASGVASGVYFYRLQAGDFVQTRRMTLLK
jgi:hypothetical protein